MVTARTQRKFTYEDYKNTPDDVRYELHDGELVVVPLTQRDSPKT